MYPPPLPNFPSNCKLWYLQTYVYSQRQFVQKYFNSVQSRYCIAESLSWVNLAGNPPIQCSNINYKMRDLQVNRELDSGHCLLIGFTQDPSAFTDFNHYISIFVFLPQSSTFDRWTIPGMYFVPCSCRPKNVNFSKIDAKKSFNLKDIKFERNHFFKNSGTNTQDFWIPPVRYRVKCYVQVYII